MKSWRAKTLKGEAIVIESPGRYILDEIVGGFINILSMSYLCPNYVPEKTGLDG